MSSEPAQQEWGIAPRFETDGNGSNYECRPENPREDRQLPDEDHGHPQGNTGDKKSLVIGNLPLSEMQIRDKPATGVLARVRQRYNLESDTRLRAGWEVYAATALDDGAAVTIKICSRAIPGHLLSQADRQLAFWAALRHENLEPIIDYEVATDGIWVACRTDGTARDWPAEMFAGYRQRMLDNLSRVANALDSLGLESGYRGLSLNAVTLVNDIPMLSLPLPDVVAASSDPGDCLAAPETRRAGNGGPKADQYSLAIIAAECLLARKLKARPARAIESSKLRQQIRLCLLKACHDNPSRRHADIDAFMGALSDSFVPRGKKLLRHPATLPSAVGIIVLSIVLIAFQQNLSRFYEEHKPALIADDTETQMQAVKRLASARELVTQLSRFSADLHRSVEQAESYLTRQKNSSRPVAAEISRAEAEFERLITEQIFFDAEVMSRDRIIDIKSTLAVVEQRYSDKAYADAVKLVEPIHLQLEKAVGAGQYLTDIASAINGVNELRRHLPTKGLSESAAMQERELVELDRQLLDANDFDALIAQVFEPLAALYAAEIQHAENVSRNRRQARMKSYLDSVESDLVDIPAGQFRMGIKHAGATDSRPIRIVQIQAFRIGRYPVTNRQFNRYLQNKGKSARTDGSPDHPVVNVSWDEAQSFTNWLSKHSGARYRLPTEAEWEYVARANIRTHYAWGNGIGRNNTNCADCGSRWDGKSTSPVGSFRPNQFGVFDIVGNVWEWNRDCYLPHYRNAPTDGAAVDFDSCQQRVARGGAWNTPSKKLHPALRSTAPPEARLAILGFRIVKAP